MKDRWGAGAATGTALGLASVALVRDTSFADRGVFARWSVAHFGLIVIVLGASVFCVVGRVRPR